MCRWRRYSYRELHLLEIGAPRFEVECVCSRFQQANIEVLFERNQRERAAAGPLFDTRIEGDGLTRPRHDRRLKNAITPVIKDPASVDRGLTAATEGRQLPGNDSGGFRRYPRLRLRVRQ